MRQRSKSPKRVAVRRKLRIVAVLQEKGVGNDDPFSISINKYVDKLSVIVFCALFFSQFDSNPSMVHFFLRNLTTIVKCNNYTDAMFRGVWYTS